MVFARVAAYHCRVNKLGLTHYHHWPLIWPGMVWSVWGLRWETEYWWGVDDGQVRDNPDWVNKPFIPPVNVEQGFAVFVVLQVAGRGGVNITWGPPPNIPVTCVGADCSRGWQECNISQVWVCNNYPWHSSCGFSWRCWLTLATNGGVIGRNWAKRLTSIRQFGSCSLLLVPALHDPSMPRINKIIYLFTALRASVRALSPVSSQFVSAHLSSPGRVRPGSPHPSKLFMVLKVSDRGRSQPTESDSECQPHGSDQSEASIGAPMTNQRPVSSLQWPIRGQGWEEFFQQMDTAVIITSRVGWSPDWDHTRSEVFTRGSPINPLETMAQSVGFCKPC